MNFIPSCVPHYITLDALVNAAAHIS